MIETLDSTRDDVAALEAEVKQLAEVLKEKSESLAVKRAYLKGLEEGLKILSRPARVPSLVSDRSPRPESDIGLAQSYLQKIGKPAHISEIVTGIGKPLTKGNKLSLSGSLGPYVRDGRIFTRPAPNTFGLYSFAAAQQQGEGE